MDPSWTPPVLVPIVSFLMGLGFGGAQMMPWIIFADTVDVEEFATGKRPTASYSGMMTLVRKLVGAASVGMIGPILTLSGYVTNENTDVYLVQSPEALLAIRLLMGILVAGLIAISLVSSFKFRVNNKKLERMRYFIDLNREGKLGDITEEEKAERDALVKELYGNKAVTHIYTKEEAEAIKRAEEEANVESVKDENIETSNDMIAVDEVAEITEENSLSNEE